jgi:hypothetical protein
MNADDKDVVDITLRLTLRRGVWTTPDKWDWTDLLDLEGSEIVEVTGYKPVQRIYADGSVLKAEYVCSRNLSDREDLGLGPQVGRWEAGA